MPDGWPMRIFAVCFWVLTVLVPGGQGSDAQQLGLPDSEILTVSSDRMYAESAFGRRVSRDIEVQSDVLATENRRIELELMEEERDLTERRADMDPDAFRELADAFDAKVQEIRQTQDDKARVLVRSQEEQRVIFLQAARPILADLMRESGASVVLERSSVFLSANIIDVTDVAISRLDAVLGDGAEPAED